MPWKQDPLWDHFVLDLELLSSEDPANLIQLTSQLHLLLFPEDTKMRLTEFIDGLDPQLNLLMDVGDEGVRLSGLNHYFFSEKRLSVVRGGVPEARAHFPLLALNQGSVAQVSRNSHGSGSAIGLSLLYTYFANTLDLPVYPVMMGSSCLLKWLTSPQPRFLDVNQFCKPMEEAAVVALVQGRSLAVGRDGSAAEVPHTLEIQTHKQVFMAWLNELYLSLKAQSDWMRMRTTLTVVLEVDPNHLSSIGYRALVNQKLGFEAEAAEDYSRYFALAGVEKAPPELVLGFQTIKFRDSNKPLGPLDRLH